MRYSRPSFFSRETYTDYASKARDKYSPKNDFSPFAYIFSFKTTRINTSVLVLLSHFPARRRRKRFSGNAMTQANKIQQYYASVIDRCDLITSMAIFIIK